MATEVQFSCENCSRTVIKVKDKVGAGRFCCLACSHEYRARVAMVTKPCETCGVSVTRKGKHDNPHTYCSPKCSANSKLFQASLAARNAAKYPDNRNRRPCDFCGCVIDKPKSLRTGRRVYCSRICEKAHALAEPVRQKARGGYIKIFVGAGHRGSYGHGHILEHRKVMQDSIGRALLKHENVHHINGVRDDNRLENLELWSSSQPSGQRVVDKLAWAREIVATYEGLPLM